MWGVCFHPGSEGSGVPPLSSTEFAALGAVHLVGTLVIFLYSAATLLFLILKRSAVRDGGTSGNALDREHCFVAAVWRLVQNRRAESLLVGVQFGLALPLLWGFWRLRSIERQLSETTTGRYAGNDWGFGQVVAIAMFVPVAAEMFFVWVEGRREKNEGENDSALTCESLQLAPSGRWNAEQP
ncbi:hypothetical protein QBC34DRAFT_163539 [Podospora aff. communis PSN243]|uniref:Uncharacterized protein n=1 Tax=Podospora aff. communis PSN243 TaxID=3040156 RepID=A0AAV9GBW2_9PEZI|nr:hypothetical protein QBC34DRAFT_163539 [Podospora aff. communis PSN243]